MNCVDSEIKFLKDILDTCRIIISCGVKGSSKTFTILNFLKFCIINRCYTTFYLVMPNFNNDQNTEQYEFLSKSGANIKIYTRYSPLVMSMIIASQLKNKQKSILVIDDGTSSGKDISHDETFQKAVTESRHLQLTIWLVTHALSNIISPMIRANVDYVFLYKVTNDKLLESFYQEYLSLFPDFKNYPEFKKMFFAQVLKVQYNGLFLNMKEHVYCMNVKDWKLNTEDLDKLLPHKKKTHIKAVEVDTKKDQIIQSLEEKKQKLILAGKIKEKKDGFNI
jgi:hypothetical protein